jgi:hypothetical protein
LVWAAALLAATLASVARSVEETNISWVVQNKGKEGRRKWGRMVRTDVKHAP